MNNGFVIRPVVWDGDEDFVRVADEGEAPDLWTIYEITPEGLEYAAADFHSKEEAEKALPMYERCRGCAHLDRHGNHWSCNAVGEGPIDLIERCPEGVEIGTF